METPKTPTGPDVTTPFLPRPEAVQLRARRSPRLIALGVLAVALGGLGAATLYSGATQSETAVVMARDVPRGKAITQADLKLVTVPTGLTVETLGGSELAGLVGKTALTDLPEGAFPAERHLGADPIPHGLSLVGIKLSQGRMPATALPQGTRVQLVGLEESATSSFPAEVASHPMSADDGNGLVLDVLVDDDAAARVAALAAEDRLALVAVGEG